MDIPYNSFPILHFEGKIIYYNVDSTLELLQKYSSPSLWEILPYILRIFVYLIVLPSYFPTLFDLKKPAPLDLKGFRLFEIRILLYLKPTLLPGPE